MITMFQVSVNGVSQTVPMTQEAAATYAIKHFADQPYEVVPANQSDVDFWGPEWLAVFSEVK